MNSNIENKNQNSWKLEIVYEILYKENVYIISDYYQCLIVKQFFLNLAIPYITQLTAKTSVKLYSLKTPIKREKKKMICGYQADVSIIIQEWKALLNTKYSPTKEICLKYKGWF